MVVVEYSETLVTTNVTHEETMIFTTVLLDSLSFSSEPPLHVYETHAISPEVAPGINCFRDAIQLGIIVAIVKKPEGV
jgi:hypothetical protein